MNNNNHPKDPIFEDINSYNFNDKKDSPKKNYDETTKPQNINIKDFLPSQPNDLMIITDILKINDNFKTIMNSRIQKLESIYKLWEKGNKSEAFQALTSLNDLSVSNDILNYAIIQTDLDKINIRPDDAIVILPIIINLIHSQHDSYFKTGAQSSYIILKLFYNVMVETKGCVPLGGGYDLNREDKIRKYDKIANYFSEIRKQPNMTSKLTSEIDGLDLEKIVKTIDYFLKKYFSFN